MGSCAFLRENKKNVQHCYYTFYAESFFLDASRNTVFRHKDTKTFLNAK